MEYEESRIPDSELIPQQKLRFETHRLRPDAEISSTAAVEDAVKLPVKKN
jgi:hypothetical protein